MSRTCYYWEDGEGVKAAVYPMGNDDIIPDGWTFIFDDTSELSIRFHSNEASTHARWERGVTDQAELDEDSQAKAWAYRSMNAVWDSLGEEWKPVKNTAFRGSFTYDDVVNVVQRIREMGE